VTARELPDQVERLSSTEADDLMAGLILEEKQQQKPGLTKKSIYKFIAYCSVITILVLQF